MVSPSTLQSSNISDSSPLRVDYKNTTRRNVSLKNVILILYKGPMLRRGARVTKMHAEIQGSIPDSADQWKTEHCEYIG